MRHRISLGELTRLFARVGCLSWGGGGATLAMLHGEFCTRRRLLDDVEFQVLFGLARMVPGMNLLALTVLLGFRFHRWAGAVLALAGLTAPCFACIVALAALLGGRNPAPWIAGVVRGLGPAAAALLLHTLVRLAQGSLQGAARREQAAWLLLMAGAAGAALLRAGHPAWIVVLGGGLGVLAWRGGRRAPGVEPGR